MIIDNLILGIGILMLLFLAYCAIAIPYYYFKKIFLKTKGIKKSEKNIHNEFKHTEIYKILGPFSYLMVIWGALTAFELSSNLLGYDFYTIGKVYAYVLPDPVFEQGTNILLPRAINYNFMHYIFTFFYLIISYCSLGYFLIYTFCVYAVWRSN